MLYKDGFIIEDIELPHLEVSDRDRRFVYDVDLREIIFNSAEKILLTDGEGKILLMNQVAEEHLGFCLTGLGDVTIQECLRAGTLDHSVTLESIRLKKRVTGLIRTWSGQYFMTTSTPLMDSEGTVRLVLCSSRNKDHVDRFHSTVLEANRIEKDRFRSAVSYLGELTVMGRRMVAESPAMKRILSLARTVAGTDSTVLLSGESGTGKDMLAHFIHLHSGRAEEAFIPVGSSCV